jgi:hypothetical protein
LAGGAIHGLGAQGVVQLRVLDQAQVPAVVMRSSRAKVDEILRRANVKTTWIECPLTDLDIAARARCNQPIAGADFWVHLVKRKLPGANRHSLGQTMFAASGDAAIYVYYPDLTVFAAAEKCDPAIVLATVLTHEIGHVLLRNQSHSRRGIMVEGLTREHIKLAETGSLLFTVSEARRISRQVLEWPSRPIDDR